MEDPSDYAPGITDVRDRVMYGIEHYPDLYSATNVWDQWIKDLQDFVTDSNLHRYTFAQITETRNAITTTLEHVRNRQSEVNAKRDEILANIQALHRITTMYQAGPAHLIALEQQYQALRLNMICRAYQKPGVGSLTKHTLDALRTSTSYCWSSEPVEAVAASARSLPGTSAPQAESLGLLGAPGASGWWWFETPVPVQTCSNPADHVCAMLWQRAETGTRLWTFVMEHINVNGTLEVFATPTIAWYWEDGQSIDLCLDETAEFIDETPAGWDRAPTDVSRTAIDFFTRFWLAGAIWLKQRVLTQERRSVPRQPGRALARTHKLPAVPQVEIVQLRRAQSRGESASGTRSVDWSCRWIVHGFWREQPCGSGLTQRRTIWIDDFIKGPADAPLKVPTRIYAVTR